MTELGNVYDQLNELEQCFRKNSIEIHGIPKMLIIQPKKLW